MPVEVSAGAIVFKKNGQIEYLLLIEGLILLLKKAGIFQEGI